MFANSGDILCLQLPHTWVDAWLRAYPHLTGYPFQIVMGQGARARVLDSHLPQLPAGSTVQQFREAAQSIQADRRVLQALEDEIATILQKFSPVWQKAATGRYYISLHGCHQLFGEGLALRILQEVEALGLRVRGGRASRPVLSWLAAMRKRPGQLLELELDREATFLESCSIFDLPDVPRTMLRNLYASWNVKNCKDLQLFNRQYLHTMLGERGVSLYDLARGNLPRVQAKQMYRLSQRHFQRQVFLGTFERSLLADPTFLRSRFFGLLAPICQELRHEHLAASGFQVWVAYSDGHFLRRQGSFKHPLDDEKKMDQALRSIWQEAFDRRVSWQTLGIRVDRLHPRGVQQDLFETAQTNRLLAAFDAVHKKGIGADYANQILKKNDSSSA